MSWEILSEEISCLIDNGGNHQQVDACNEFGYTRQFPHGGPDLSASFFSRFPTYRIPPPISVRVNVSVQREWFTRRFIGRYFFFYFLYRSWSQNSNFVRTIVRASLKNKPEWHENRDRGGHHRTRCVRTTTSFFHKLSFDVNR